MFRPTSVLAVAAVSLLVMGATPLRVPHLNDHAIPGGPPRVQLADRSGGEVSRKALLADPSVRLHGCVPSAQVIAFSFMFTNAEGKKITYRTHEATFSTEMIAALKSMREGSSFTITDLDVKDDKGAAYVVPEVTFTLSA